MTKWGARLRGRRFPCAIGRSGIGEKTREGDGLTPRGVYKIALIAHRRDRLPFEGRAFSRVIGPQDIWSDDPKSTTYNSWQRGRFVGFHHEQLFRSDPLYDLLCVIDFNWPIATSGKGSAIFLHIWRKPRHPTEGCVAFSKRDLRWICANWSERARVHICD